MTNQETAKRLRVGIFMALSVGLLVGGVFILGRSHDLFSPKVLLFASFKNTSGLVVGAPVRLAGVNIGIVQEIRFFKDPGVSGVKVVLSVEEKWLERIRVDSVASLGTKGMLGDMLIDVTVGDPEKAPHVDGDTLLSLESAGLGQVIASVESTVTQVKALVGVVDARVQEMLTEQLAKDVGRIVASLADAMQHVQKGNGLAHALIYDPQLGLQTKEGVKALGRLATGLAAPIAKVDALLAELRGGDGLIHALVYGKDGTSTLRELARTATGLGDAVAEIQTGNGMLHTLIFEEDKTNLLEDLAHVSAVLRRVADDVEQGRGTIGGLLKDPTVYQDLTTVLGNLKRNVLLKSIVRLTVKNEGLGRTGDVVAP